MATLTLTKVWINRLDTGDAVSAQSYDRSQGYDMDGDVETYAGGRQRAVSVEGERGTFACTLRRVSLATVVTLRQWKGIALQARDHRGQLWVGVCFVVTPIELPESAWYDVALTVRTVDAPEGV